MNLSRRNHEFVQAPPCIYPCGATPALNVGDRDILEAKSISMWRSSGIILAAFLVSSLAPAQNAGTFREPDVPYVPTTETAVKAMLKLAKVKPNDVVYDLGCGDGRIVIAAAKNYGARGVGIDIDPARIREARENARRAGVENRVEFREQDLFQADFREATVVALFLLPAINRRLRPQLETLKPGTRIVTNTFEIGGWRPVKDLVVKNDARDEYYFGSRRVFLWIVPRSK
jgi:SAM-dependent methyltransferase